MNAKSKNEINSEEEIYLYDCWKVLVKRKKILINLFFVPLVIVTIVSLSLPRYYRGEAEISYPATPATPATPVTSVSPVTPAPNIVRLIGEIDDTKKNKIFTNSPGAIKRVLISLPKTYTDKVSILIDAKTADIIPQAFKDIVDHINNMPELKEENARIKEENDFKMNSLTEAKKANLVFLNQITRMMKKGQVSQINFNPADLIKKDRELSLEIRTLQEAVVKFGTLGPLSITVQPSNSRIKQIIMITSLLSLFIGIVVVFFLEYIDRVKVYEDEQRRLP